MEFEEYLQLGLEHHRLDVAAEAVTSLTGTFRAHRAGYASDALLARVRGR